MQAITLTSRAAEKVKEGAIKELVHRTLHLHAHPPRVHPNAQPRCTSDPLQHFFHRGPGAQVSPFLFLKLFSPEGKTDESNHLSLRRPTVLLIELARTKLPHSPPPLDVSRF